MDATAPTLLLVNKYYHDTGIAGGPGRYVVQEEERLAAAGWRVVPFTMADDHVRPSPWERYFVRERDFSRPRWSRRAPGDALAMIWNREAAVRLDALLREVRPDVAHLHNVYHHLSPSIIPVLGRHGIPVVMTLHDLRLLCPAITMLRDGEVCERCRGGRFHEAVLGRCVKGSRLASLLAAVETAHQHARGIYRRGVTRFICPSRFYRDKFAEWGYPPEKLLHLPNFVDLEFWRPSARQADAAYLYFGRLSPEKGLATLLAAQARWEREDGDGALELRLAGTGPAAEDLRRLAGELGARRVRFLGGLAAEALRDALARVRFTALPSEWYENAPMSTLESLAAGRPVLATRIGGNAEILDDGREGVLVPPRDPDALLAGLRRAAALGPDAARLARAKAEAVGSLDTHMARLEEILRAVARRQTSD